MKYLRMLAFMPLHLTVWLIAFLIESVFEIIGWFVVPFLYKYRWRQFDMMPLWSIPWVNPEDWHGGELNYDGSVPPWYIEKEGKDDFKTFYKYHAFRNAANGLRTMGLNVKVETEKLEYVTPRYHRHYEFWYRMNPRIKFYYCWEGPLWAGMKLMWRYNDERFGELKLGWRFGPGDAEEGLHKDSVRRELGCAFASKFAPWRKI